MFCAAMALLGAPAVAQQDYPTKPVRVIASSAAGGISDIFIRTLGDELAKALGPAGDHREPRRRQLQHRPPRLRRSHA